MRVRPLLMAVVLLAVLGVACDATVGRTAHVPADGSEPCRGELARVRLGTSGGAGREQGQAVIFTNIADRACVATGFPEFSALTAAGRKVRVRFVTQTYLAGHPVKTVRLGPGESASVLYEWADAPSTQAGGGCLEVVAVTVGLQREAGIEGDRTFRIRDDVCQGAVNVLPFTAGSNPFGFAA